MTSHLGGSKTQNRRIHPGRPTNAPDISGIVALRFPIPANNHRLQIDLPTVVALLNDIGNVSKVLLSTANIILCLCQLVLNVCLFRYIGREGGWVVALKKERITKTILDLSWNCLESICLSAVVSTPASSVIQDKPVYLTGKH